MSCDHVHVAQADKVMAGCRLYGGREIILHRITYTCSDCGETWFGDYTEQHEVE